MVQTCEGFAALSMHPLLYAERHERPRDGQAGSGAVLARAEQA